MGIFKNLKGHFRTQDENKALKEQLDEKVLQYNRLEKVVAQKEIEIEDLKQKVRFNVTLADKKEKSLADLQRKYNNLCRTNRNLERENERLKAKYEM